MVISSLFHKIKLSIYLYSRIYTKMITLYYYKHCSIKSYFNDVISAAVRQVAALLVLATICRRPVTLTFDLLTLQSVWESHVTWGTPVQSFVFLGLLVFELEPMYATSDGRTDGRTPITALCPLGGGIINAVIGCKALQYFSLVIIFMRTHINIHEAILLQPIATIPWIRDIM